MGCDGVLPPYNPALKDGNELMEGYSSIGYDEILLILGLFNTWYYFKYRSAIKRILRSRGLRRKDNHSDSRQVILSGS